MPMKTTLVTRRSAVVAQHAREVEHLVDDLLRREVAAQPQAPGGAERAAHGAADLRGDADGGAAGVPS